MRHETVPVEGQAPDELVYFSPREAQVLHAVCAGLTNKEIATLCGLTQGTVRQYVSNLLRGLKVSSRLELCIWGLQHPLCFLPNHPADIRLHPTGCKCPAIYCSAMRAASEPSAIDPAA